MSNAIDTCSAIASLQWTGVGVNMRPMACGEPATYSNGKEPPYRLVACDRHASNFYTPTPIPGASVGQEGERG